MRQALCSALVFFPLVLTTSLQGKDYYSTHLTDEDTEAQLMDSSPDSLASECGMKVTVDCRAQQHYSNP